MTKIVSFVFIMAVSLIAVVVAVIGVLVSTRSRIARKARNGETKRGETDKKEYIICRYCGSKNRAGELRCRSCGASL